MVKILQNLHFAKQSREYARHRPQYPGELYQFLLSNIDYRETAWDCGTGNGQTAEDLALFFDDVIATDPCESQIQHAVKKKNIDYRVMPAEVTDIEDHSIDLITVAQAIHWFDIEEFYKEADRVLKANGAIAYWGYGQTQMDKDIQIHIQDFSTRIVGSYWSHGNSLIAEEYNSLPEIYPPMIKKDFIMEKEWTLDDLLGYLRTWSAVQKLIDNTGKNPLFELEQRILPDWGERKNKRTVRWKVFTRLGKKKF